MMTNDITANITDTITSAGYTARVRSTETAPIVTVIYITRGRKTAGVVTVNGDYIECFDVPRTLRCAILDGVRR